MLENFKKYLDNSADCDTIILECSQLEEFKQMNDILLDSAYDGFMIVDDELSEKTKVFFSFIRNIWDIAYSHGEMDTKKENNLEIDLTE